MHYIYPKYLHIQIKHILSITSVSMATEEHPIRCEISVPFPTNQFAEIALNSLSPDPEPRNSLVTKEFILDNNILRVNYVAREARILRVVVGAFFDLLLLVIESIDRFRTES